MSMPDKPISIDLPAWTDEAPKLSLSYEVNETYKKWLDNVKVTDFEGTGFSAKVQINPVEHFSFGFSKKFLVHQSWINKENKDMPILNFGSNNHFDEVFIKLGSDNFKLMYGHVKSTDNFNGHYELHQDIVNALGSEPDVNFNTKGTDNYIKALIRHKKLGFSYSYDLSKYKHLIDAATNIMELSINHKRQARNREYELSYALGKKWFPYIRFSDYCDTGFGRDYRNNRVLIGRNNSSFKFVVRTIGTAYKYKNGWYYADYSRLFADMAGNTFFNMVNIDPLFFFSTRFVDYQTNFKPNRGNMGRIGFKRHHRSMIYSMQYSLAKIQGDTYKFGEKTKFDGITTDTKITNRVLNLHRMDALVSRPDKCGSWNLGLKLLFPKVNSSKEKTINAGGGAGGVAAPKADKDYRGGWQLILMREFYL